MDNAPQPFLEAGRRLQDDVNAMQAADPSSTQFAEVQQQARDRDLEAQLAEDLTTSPDRLTRVEQLVAFVAEHQVEQTQMLRELLRRLPERD